MQFAKAQQGRAGGDHQVDTSSGLTPGDEPGVSDEEWQWEERDKALDKQAFKGFVVTLSVQSRTINYRNWKQKSLLAKRVIFRCNYDTAPVDNDERGRQLVPVFSMKVKDLWFTQGQATPDAWTSCLNLAREAIAEHMDKELIASSVTDDTYVTIWEHEYSRERERPSVKGLTREERFYSEIQPQVFDENPATKGGHQAESSGGRQASEGHQAETSSSAAPKLSLSQMKRKRRKAQHDTSAIS